jgi:hypothetical protein
MLDIYRGGRSSFVTMLVLCLAALGCDATPWTEKLPQVTLRAGPFVARTNMHSYLPNNNTLP